MSTNPIDYEVSMFIFCDPVALWNFMNTLTSFLLGLGQLRVPVLWAVFSYRNISIGLFWYYGLTPCPSFVDPQSFDWSEYLNDTQATAASVTCFKHVSEKGWRQIKKKKKKILQLITHCTSANSTSICIFLNKKFWILIEKNNNKKQKLLINSSTIIQHLLRK